MPAFVFTKDQTTGFREIRTRYDSDDLAIDDALDAISKLRGVIKVVLCDGPVFDRAELALLGPAAENPQP